MSFKINRTVASRQVFPKLGGAFVSLPEETIEVTYQVTDLISINAGRVWVQYTISFHGMTGNGTDIFEFEYSGSGNILDEAEIALKEKLSSN